MNPPDVALLPVIGLLCLAAGCPAGAGRQVQHRRGVPTGLLAALGCVAGGLYAMAADPGVLSTTPVALAFGLGVLNAGFVAVRLAAERGWIAAPESPADRRRVVIVRMRQTPGAAPGAAQSTCGARGISRVAAPLGTQPHKSEGQA
jgi:hypothetical protein